MVMVVQLEMMVSSRRPRQVEACLLSYSNLMEGGFAMVEGNNRMMDKELSLLRAVPVCQIIVCLHIMAHLVVGREMMFVEMNPKQCLVWCILFYSFLPMHH